MGKYFVLALALLLTGCASPPPVFQPPSGLDQDGLDARGHAVKYWLSQLRAQDPVVRAQAAEALGDFGIGQNWETVTALTKALKDDDAAVRRNAARALGPHFAAQDAVPALLELTKGDEPQVAQAAREALERMDPHGYLRRVYEEISVGQSILKVQAMMERERYKCCYLLNPPTGETYLDCDRMRSAHWSGSSGLRVQVYYTNGLVTRVRAAFVTTGL